MRKWRCLFIEKKSIAINSKFPFKSINSFWSFYFFFLLLFPFKWNLISDTAYFKQHFEFFIFLLSAILIKIKLCSLALKFRSTCSLFCINSSLSSSFLKKKFVPRLILILKSYTFSSLADSNDSFRACNNSIDFYDYIFISCNFCKSNSALSIDIAIKSETGTLMLYSGVMPTEIRSRSNNPISSGTENCCCLTIVLGDNSILLEGVS